MDAAQHSPAQRAEAALSSPIVMCDLLAQCRQFKVKGWWDGSAFRSHPVGLIRDVIKFTNYWHVDQHCDIQITDGEGWNRNVCQDSFSHQSPHPKAIGGHEVIAWRSGRWTSTEMEVSLKPQVLAILTEAAEHIAQAAAIERAKELEKSEKRIASQAEIVSAAIAKATGSAS